MTLAPMANMSDAAALHAIVVPADGAANGTAERVERFRRELLTRLFAWCYRRQDVTPDYVQFVPAAKQGLAARLRSWVAQRLARHGYVRQGFASVEGAERLLAIFADAERFAALHAQLADQPSRDLLLDLLCYRVLGDRHVTFPLNTPHYWQQFAAVNRRYLERPQTACVAGMTLNAYTVPIGDRLLYFEAHPWNILNNFLVEQYAYTKLEPPLRVRPGDVVIDGGGCWGDTALYFLAATANEGIVFSFEFLPENLAVLRRNLARNPELAHRCRVVERALWHTSEQELCFTERGAATRVDAAPADRQGSAVRTLTIDDLADRERLTRLDFIKLDIEGAELPALEGAVRTLRRFRPTLALAAYHRPDDLATLPAFLDRLDLGYRYYLDHFTVQGGETVLFAVAR